LILLFRKNYDLYTRLFFNVAKILLAANFIVHQFSWYNPETVDSLRLCIVCFNAFQASQMHSRNLNITKQSWEILLVNKKVY
jgi:hypothetical protein